MASDKKKHKHTDLDMGGGELSSKAYNHHLKQLQVELVKLQSWVQYKKQKVAVIFEGRDAAGKGGVIQRITQRLNDRFCRVVALGVPSPREEGQWYFQRYLAHLPTAGEIVLYDRSWYTLAGVERVMGFFPESVCAEFFRSCPELERMLVRSGVKIIKYWLEISPEEQLRRLKSRFKNPAKHWKLSPMDIESVARWEQYSQARDEMFKHTNISEAPWWIVNANDKHRARLNCISHLLSLIPYQTISMGPLTLPKYKSLPENMPPMIAPGNYIPCPY